MTPSLQPQISRQINGRGEFSTDARDRSSENGDGFGLGTVEFGLSASLAAAKSRFHVSQRDVATIGAVKHSTVQCS